MGDTVHDALIDTATSKILLAIADGKCYKQEVARETELSYAHTVKVIDRLTADGYLNLEMNGRKSDIELTEEGEQVVESLQKICGAVSL